jgi:hypothetical protein
VAESYYAARSRRDPAWREQQLADAIERGRRAREEDPERIRALACEKTARYRERLRLDPERLAAYRAKAAERERERRRGLTPEERAKASRAAVARKRRLRKIRTAGLTLAELQRRVPGDRESLRIILSSEVRSGRVELHRGRYSLNGVDPDLRRALLDLDLH